MENTASAVVRSTTALEDLHQANVAMTQTIEILRRKFQELPCKDESHRIPDPVQLLQRLSCLESSMETIQTEYSELQKKMAEVSIQVSDVLIQNTHDLEKLSLITPRYGSSSIGQNKEVAELVRAISRSNMLQLQNRPIERRENQSVLHSSGRSKR